MSNRSNGGSGGWGRDLQQRGDDSKINEKKNDQVEWIWGPILISQLDWGLFPVPQLINHKLKNFQILKLRKSWVWILSSLMILVFRNLGIQVPEGLFDCKSQQRFSGGTDTPTIQQARPLTCSSVHLLQSAATCATSLAKLPLTTLHNALHLCFLHSSWHRLFSHVYKAGTTSALVLLNSSIWHVVPNIVGT